MKKAIIIGTLIGALAGLANAQMFAQMFGNATWTPASLNPVAWYKGENNSLDTMAFANGTWTGSESYATGKIGSAFNMDGSDKRIISSVVIPDGDATICAWVNPTTFSNYRVIAGSGCVGDLNGMSIFLSATEWIIQTRQSPTAVNAVTAHSSISAFTHIAGVRGGGKLKLYVNGELTNEVTCAISPVSPYDSFGIGERKSNAGTWAYPFIGKIDDVMVFGKALTTIEIKKIYDESINKYGSTW